MSTTDSNTDQAPTSLAMPGVLGERLFQSVALEFAELLRWGV